jgi:hypothetical protein
VLAAIVGVDAVVGDSCDVVAARAALTSVVAP